MSKDMETKVEELVTKTGEAIEKIEQTATSWEKDLHDVQKTVDEIKAGQTGVTKEQVAELLKDAMAKQDNERITNRILNDSQKAALSIPDPWSDYAMYHHTGYEIKELARKGIEERDHGAMNLLAGMEPQDDAHKYYARMATDVQIMDAYGRAQHKSNYQGFAKTFPRMSQKWAWYQQQFYQHATSKAASDALDTQTAASLGNWVPTGWSTEIRELIMLQLRVAALFQRFNMPTTPFEIPVNLTDTLGDYVDENLSITDPYATSGQTALIQKIVGEMKQFNARKIRARMMTSQELIEDALTAILPLIRNQLVRILANSQEYAIINGQRAGGIDTGYTASSNDLREMWDGLRKIAIARSHTVDFGGSYTLTNMMALRKQLGEAGVELGELAYVSSPIGYLNIIAITEVLTVDKYGDGASVRRGEQGQVAGIPLVISRYMPENLNASGVYDGTTTTNTGISLVRTDAWLAADKRNVTVEQERIIQTDQSDLVAMQRMDFQPIFTQDASSVDVPVASYGYDIPAS